MTGEKKAAATKYHRKTLMTAADRLLVEFGYDGMNMNMLAKEAGYSKATVYVYFRSKDEIVGALCAERLELLRKELSLVTRSDLDAAEKLAEVGNVIKEFASEDGVYFDFVTERCGDGSEVSAALEECVNGIISDLGALAPVEELKRKWYELYGRIKTEKMFAEA